MSKKKSDTLNQILLNVVFIIIAAIIIIPFILVVSVSFSNEKDIITYGYSFIPRRFDLSAYKFVFGNSHSIISAYKVTAITTVLGTMLSVVLMSMIAYPLSRRNFTGRRFVSFYCFFTMLFSGGLVPTYILITQYLHIDDTIWVFILPSLINVWHVFLLRTFFSGLPAEMIESALIDGADEYRILFSMVLPLSKPVLATVALLGALIRWNDWYTAMLYINDESLLTLQYLLQRILLQIRLLQQQSVSVEVLGMSVSDLPSETARMAMAVVAAGPMLLIFPFFQRYFVRGLTVGSVKG